MTDKITIERETLERAIADYDFAAGNDSAALSWIRARDNIIGLLRAALAAQQAEPQEPLTDSYVQQVPDKCDRIVWRNRYYSLPPAPAAVPLTDEQTLRGLAGGCRCDNNENAADDCRYPCRARMAQDALDDAVGVMSEAIRNIQHIHGIAAAGDKQ